MTLRKWAAGIAAFVLVLCAAPATATTYYVNGTRETGNDAAYQRLLDQRDARAGTSSALAWGRISKANATVKSGDVVILERILGANYTGNIDPACQDTVGAAGTGVPTNPWVTYIGSLTYPEYASVTGGTISKPYVSVKGVAFTGALTLTSNRDSIQYCTAAGNVTAGGADYCYVGNNVFNGYAFTVDGCDPLATSPYTCQTEGPFSRGNVFDSNHFTNLFGSAASGGGNNFAFIGVDSTNVLFNVFDINAVPGVGPSLYFQVKHSSYVAFRGNRRNYNVVYPEAGSSYSVLQTVRDSVKYLSFDCDSVFQVGNERVQFRFSSAGNEFLTDSASNNDNHITYDSCYVHLRNSENGLWSQNQLNQATITRSVIINENGPALTIGNGAVGRNFIDHNTLVGRVESDGQSVANFRGASFQDTTLVTNNIFYSFGTAPPEARAAAVSYVSPKYDSTFAATGTDHANHLISDHNLYSYYGSSAFSGVYSNPPECIEPDTVGKRSIRFDTGWSGNGFGINFAWPGTHTTLRAATSLRDTVTVVAGVFSDSVTITLPAALPLSDSTFKVAVVRTTVTPPSSGKLAAATTTVLGDFLPNTIWTSRWCPGCDDSSRYGSPVFRDSTAAGFNPQVYNGSLVDGAGSGGSDIGAISAIDRFFYYYYPTTIFLGSISQEGEVEFYISSTDTTDLGAVDSVGGMAGRGEVAGLTVSVTPTGPGETFHVPSVQKLAFSYVPGSLVAGSEFYANVYFADPMAPVHVVKFVVIASGAGISLPPAIEVPYTPPVPEER